MRVGPTITTTQPTILYNPSRIVPAVYISTSTDQQRAMIALGFNLYKIINYNIMF